MSLREEIESLQREMLPHVPAEALAVLQSTTGDLIETGIAAGALGEEATLPAFSLPGADGTPVSSDALLAKGPLVVSFYRGGWCPYCSLELRALLQAVPEIRALGAELVAISPETPDKADETHAKIDRAFSVLTDAGNAYARQLGLVFRLADALRPIYAAFGIDLEASNGDASWELPVPATYVVRPDGTVALAHVDADYTKRLEPSEILAALRSLAGASLATAG